MIITGYFFTLCNNLVDIINQSFILQFAILLSFAYIVINILRRLYNSDDTKGGVSL